MVTDAVQVLEQINSIHAPEKCPRVAKFTRRARLFSKGGFTKHTLANVVKVKISREVEGLDIALADGWGGWVGQGYEEQGLMEV